MKIVYDKNNGKILNAISKDQDVEIYYKYFDSDFKSNLSYIEVDVVPVPLRHYYVSNKEVCKYNQLEVNEIDLHGKVLTEEERLITKLRPTKKEVEEAEQTIKILSLIEEVI